MVPCRCSIRGAMARVRAEHPDDHRRVAEIHERAFGGPEEARLVASLRVAARPQLSLVAERDDAVVGHVFFSPVAIEAPGAPAAAALAPVAVHPEHQKRGIGSALIRAGLRGCPERGWQAVFLVGSPDYYRRFGFVLAAPRGFSYGDERFEPVHQLLELTPGVLAGYRGRVRYHPAFAESGTG